MKDSRKHSPPTCRKGWLIDHPIYKRFNGLERERLKQNNCADSAKGKIK